MLEDFGGTGRQVARTYRDWRETERSIIQQPPSLVPLFDESERERERDQSTVYTRPLSRVIRIGTHLDVLEIFRLDP